MAFCVVRVDFVISSIVAMLRYLYAIRFGMARFKFVIDREKEREQDNGLSLDTVVYTTTSLKATPSTALLLTPKLLGQIPVLSVSSTVDGHGLSLLRLRAISFLENLLSNTHVAEFKLRIL